MIQSLYYHLTNNAGLTALIGTRLYRSLGIQDSTQPYIVYTVSGRVNDYCMAGKTDYTARDVEFNIISTTPTINDTIAEALGDALAFQTTVIGDAGSTTYIFSTRLRSEFDDYDLVDGSEDPFYKLTQTYRISYKED